jgi:DNA-binding Xre family transcriptional regulator
MISYKPLFETMKKKGITQHDLLNIVGFDRSTFNKLLHDKYVTIRTIEKLCRILDCRIEDIIKVIPDDDWKPYVPDPSIKRKTKKH